MMPSINVLWAAAIAAASALAALIYARKTPDTTRESIVDWLARFGKVFNAWLNDVRQGNAKAISVIGLYIGSFLVWAAATLLQIPIDLAAFGLWLGFVAAAGGFSMSQFKTERTTDYGYVQRTAAAKQPVAPTTTTTETTGPSVTTTAPATPPAEGG